AGCAITSWGRCRSVSVPEPVTHQAPGEDPTELVVATYNIHAAIGSDDHYDPERIERVLAEIGADVVALQEVRHPAMDPPGLAHSAAIGHGSGYRAVIGSTLVDRRGGYGNML